ncbi:MAG: TetR/AcrR family transcriptional regulator [Desulfohalobiaceae bacterium]
MTVFHQPSRYPLNAYSKGYSKDESSWLQLLQLGLEMEGCMVKRKSTFLQLKESEREHRKDLILDAAISLFSQRPFAEIGMRDIAQEAGISPASIYRYFPSRDAILLEVLGQDIQNGEKKQLRRLETGEDSIEEIATGIVDFFLDREATLQMLSHFMLKDSVDPEIQEKFEETKTYYLEHFDRIMVQAGAAPGNIRLFSHAFFASILGIVLAFRNLEEDKEENRKNLHRMARLVAIVFKNGVPCETTGLET